MSEDVDFDLDFRPADYWGPDSILKLVISGIKGADRQEWAKAALEAGQITDIEAWAKERLTDDERISVGRIHPRLMGGEYLPDSDAREVEIARVILQSTTQDVTSVRAKATPDHIEYRMVDEYENKWEISPTRSVVPLSTRELVAMLDGSRCSGFEPWNSGVVWGPLSMNLEYSDDPKSLNGFVSVTSEFYPDLGRYYHRRINRFLLEATPPKADEEG